jgi:glycosyltransferase involved in cell wall biosynthesis
LFGRLARIIVTSQHTAERLGAEFGVAPDRIAVVEPGTEDAVRCPGSGGPACEILSVGALIPRKGHDSLLRCLARLFDLDWRLTIAGAAPDAAYAQSLHALCETLEIAGRVTFADGALEALWRKADLFALATHYEGYGMAIAEALKRGIPVAVTAGGAAGALVSAQAGTVCPAGDEVTFSKALRRLIFDKGLRAEAAEAAWQVGQTLPDWPTQTAKFAGVIA